MMDSIVLDEPSSSTPYVYGHGSGGRAIDRHNPIIQDEKRLGQGRSFPSSPAITITSPTTTKKPHRRHLWKKKPIVEDGDQKKKSVAFVLNNDEFIKRGNFISPASSSRCLLGDKATLDFSSDIHYDTPPEPPASPPPREPLYSHEVKAFKKKDELRSSPPPPPPPITVPQPTPLQPYDGLRFLDGDDSLFPPLPSSPPESPPLAPMKFYKSEASNKKHSEKLPPTAPKPPSPPLSAPPPPSSDKVVVLEVSLHCRGCERKMKKHISKIEGVTSFKIEFAAKKVTVVGDVTPLAVLTSVLKVKNAKLLTPATISTSSSHTVTD